MCALQRAAQAEVAAVGLGTQRWMPLQWGALRVQGRACRAFSKHASLMAEQKAGMLDSPDFFFFFSEITSGSVVVVFPFCIVTVKSRSLVWFQQRSGVKMGSLQLGVFYKKSRTGWETPRLCVSPWLCSLQLMLGEILLSKSLSSSFCIS